MCCPSSHQQEKHSKFRCINTMTIKAFLFYSILFYYYVFTQSPSLSSLLSFHTQCPYFRAVLIPIPDLLSSSLSSLLSFFLDPISLLLFPPLMPLSHSLSPSLSPSLFFYLTLSLYLFIFLHLSPSTQLLF